MPHRNFFRIYRTGSAHRILENKIPGSKQLEVVTGFTPVMVQCIHQTKGSLAFQMPMHVFFPRTCDLLKI